MLLKNYVTGFDTAFSQKLFFYICPYLMIFFKEAIFRLITGLKNFGRVKKLFKYFFIANGFHDFKNNCFRKIQLYYLTLHFFLFFCLLATYFH